MTPPLERLTTALADRYRVDRELGAGGMATVYLAHDLRHERDVAIKVLHPDLGAVLGADRFLTEIKTTAKLQHPHILPLLDSGAADGLLYYVMPYVRGETLRARLERDTQLAIPDAVRLASEVADALDHAHKQGVIHRDIKPENILLQDGHALVADFGIALAVQQAGGQRMTQTGLSLGTPQYMSPEQATGEKVVDARSDIYALAAVTYELLTGAPPFTGASVQAIMARVMTSDPEPPTRVRKTIPAAVEAAVLQGLAKLPADRFATAREFALALSGSGAATSVSPARPTTARRGLASLLWPVALGATVLATWFVARGGAAGGDEAPSRQQVVLWRTSLPSVLSPGASTLTQQAVLSPDGHTIVFADSTDSGWMLFRKRLNEEKAQPIEGTERGVGAFFSPDGQWIGYFGLDGTLYKVATDGGRSLKLAEPTTGNHIYLSGTWLDTDSIVYTDGLAGMAMVAASGGKVRRLNVDGQWQGSLASLSAIPGGKGFVFVGCESNCALRPNAFYYELARDSMHLLAPNVTGAWYHPSGTLLTTGRDGGLFGAPFDASTGTVTGETVSLLDQVAPLQFTLSARGDLLYAMIESGQATRQLVWVDRSGRETPVDSSWHGWFEYPALSPDGKYLAVSVQGATTDLWVRKSDGTRVQVQSPKKINWRPAFTRDGSAMLFIGALATSRDSNSIYQVAGDGSGEIREAWKAQSPVWEAELAPDGRRLAYRIDEVTGVSNIRTRLLTDTGAGSGIAAGPPNEIQLAISPNGQWIAFNSNESGTPEVYVTDFPGAKSRRLVSRGGGTEPRWSRDGKTLYFVSGGALQEVIVGDDPTRTVSEPRRLFGVSGYVRARNRAEYDVAPDGRFLMIRNPPPPPVPSVMAVRNWLPELQQKMGKR